MLYGSKLNLIQTALPAELYRLWRKVNSFRRPVSRKHLEIRSRTTSNIENVWIGVIRRCTNSLYQARNNSSPTYVPPMLLLNLIHEGIVMRLHLFGESSGDGVVHDVSLLLRG